MRSNIINNGGLPRLRSFASITGENWLTGRYLLKVLDRFGPLQRGIVLDAGAGESPFRSFFPNAGMYIRLDRSGTAPLDIIASLPQIPLRAGSVDCILLFHVMADMFEPHQLLVDACRILKPDGHILVLETTCYPPHDLPYDYYRIMPPALGRLADQAGLSLIECHHLGGFFTRFASLVNTYLLGGLKRYPFLIPLAEAGTVCSNLIWRCADSVLTRPSLAESYLAVLAPQQRTELSASC